MVHRRGEIIDSICAKTGIIRVRPGAHYLAKGELVQLNAWISTMISLQRKKRKEEDYTPFPI